MSENDNHVKQRIEVAIGRAREGVSDGIDEIDRRLREKFDLKRKLAEHTPQVLTVGAVAGFLVGFGGIPRLLRNAIAISVPIFVALRIARAQSAEVEDQVTKSDLEDFL